MRADGEAEVAPRLLTLPPLLQVGGQGVDPDLQAVWGVGVGRGCEAGEPGSMDK